MGQDEDRTRNSKIHLFVDLHFFMPFYSLSCFFSLFLCSVLLLNLILSFSDSGKEKIS